MLRVRCSSRPRPTSGTPGVTGAGRMKLVFISTVTMPMSFCALRAAVAMITSRNVITAPPCSTPKELQCSGNGA